MTSLIRRFSPLNAPIAVQVVAMLLGGLLVGQVVTLVLVLTLPPPFAPVWRLDEVAAALRGQTVHPREGPALELKRQAAPPGGEAVPDRRDVLRTALAERLGVPPEQVRLIHRPPARPWRRGFGGPAPFMGFAGRHPRHEAAGPGLEPGPRPGPGPETGPPPGPDERHWDRFDHPAFIMGSFTAALHLPSGEWRVVSPQAQPFLSGWRLDILLWFAGCVGVLAPLGYLFARRITAPLRRFTEAAEQLGRDPAGAALAPDGPAEIGAAARALNRMQARLRAYVEDRTSMIAAISHDLRTPLARMRFKLEKATPQVRVALEVDVEQMEQMVSAVLSFLRDGGRPRARTRLDLLSLLECAVDDATLGGAEVMLGEAEPAEVEGDTLALRSLFANLIDNGVKYGRAVEVTLRRVEGEARVEIADEGPGLAEIDLEQVFAPFHRTETSRNRATGGIGLGLTVARAIARAHGGDVTLAPGRPAGLVAVVRLPLSLAERGVGAVKGDKAQGPLSQRLKGERVS